MLGAGEGKGKSSQAKGKTKGEPQGQAPSKGKGQSIRTFCALIRFLFVFVLHSRFALRMSVNQAFRSIVQYVHLVVVSSIAQDAFPITSPRIMIRKTALGEQLP